MPTNSTNGTTCRQDKKNFVVLLQKLFILQTPQQHGRHHAKYQDTNYCVITNFVNPVLEEVNFWRRLEGGIAVLFGVSKTPRRNRFVETAPAKKCGDSTIELQSISAALSDTG